MNEQFIPLTQQEFFFGVNHTLKSINKNSLKAVTPPTQFEVVLKPSASNLQLVSSSNAIVTSENSNMLFGDFLWKYRWHITLLSVAAIGIGIYVYSQKKKDQESKTTIY